MKPTKKILFVCPYPVGQQAGQRFKYEQYFNLFKKNNFNVEVSPFIHPILWKVLYKKGNYFKKFVFSVYGYLRRIYQIPFLKKYDAIYIFMWVVPIGGNLIEKIYLKTSNKVIYDIEDNILINFKKKNNLISVLRSEKKITFLIKNSDFIITSSPMLSKTCENIAGGLNKVEYISASIQLNKYQPIKKHIKKNKIVIGWTGTHSSKKYLDILKNVFIEIKKKYPKSEIKIISNFNYQINNIEINNTSWSKETEIKDLLEIDIGIYPLSLDKWVEGKSGLKALQYMALGIPVVATSIGMSKKIIDNMKNGILVNNKDKEWVNAIELLIQDYNLRNLIGNNSRKTVYENYSTDVIGNQYLKILNSL
jgi:L-malate glycosyltransferase